MRHIFIAFLIFLSFVLTGCGNRHDEAKYTIGVSQCSEDIWRDKLNREMRIAQYAHPDVDLQIVSADDDSRKQIEQIKHFINAGVDLLIISPNQVNSIRPVVEEAYDKEFRDPFRPKGEHPEIYSFYRL